jgi:hypothetical protein
MPFANGLIGRNASNAAEFAMEVVQDEPTMKVVFHFL